MESQAIFGILIRTCHQDVSILFMPCFYPSLRYSSSVFADTLVSAYSLDKFEVVLSPETD